MPTKRPRIKHASGAEWTGDRPRQVWRIRRGGQGDFNFRWFWRVPGDHSRGGDAMNLHWADPWRNNYKWIAAGGHVRKMTRRELHRRTWTLGEVLRWRRPVYKGRGHRRRIVGWTQPRTYRFMCLYAKGRNRTVVAELKTKEFALPQVARQIVRDAKLANHPAWFMHLYNIGGSPVTSAIVAAVENAGGHCAVIFGKFGWQRAAYRQARKSWPVQPSATW